MKKLLQLIKLQVLVGILLFSLTANAQNYKYPWAVGVAWHWVDFWAVDLPVRDQLSQSHWVGEKIPTKISVGRSLIPSLSVEGSFGFQQYENSEIRFAGAPNDPTPEIVKLQNNFVWNSHFELQYQFANGYILSKNSIFTPYIFGSIGATGIHFAKDQKFKGQNLDPNKVTYFTAGYGVGLEIWPIKHFGINFTASYKYVPDFHDYLAYSLGLKVRFGKAKDTDKDGIADRDDACPFVWGLEQFDGCPDTDGDGLVDSLDNCPLQAGPIELKGCPDRDKDGVPDMEDKCPDQPGPIELMGCPDRDKDGISDMDDRCPDQPGPIESNGCPDRDKDGVPDMDDRCPDVPGPVELKGCPDTDNDGVADIDDMCPTDPGVIALKGCPDTDGDGIPDKDDRCPKVKGPQSNHGCPLIDTIKIKQVEKTMQSFADHIEFETAKYIIKPVSFPKLDNIVKIMGEYPNSTFAIEGHCDWIGTDEYNQTLSENRAYAVRQYFVDKGIDPSRLTFAGYGELRPRDTNTTPEGRARNRRVEIHFVQ
jgi:outer membrane protein OmpA-like peptidoglycan-associated protein